MNHENNDLITVACSPSQDNTHYNQRYSSPGSETSSAASVFDNASVSSNDGHSYQSSPSSSPIKDSSPPAKSPSPVKSEYSWDGEQYQTNTTAGLPELSAAVVADHKRSMTLSRIINQTNAAAAPTNPLTTRANPRRTQCPSQSSVCQTQSRCPPKLVNSWDRTQNFVENLVDTATQMIEVIWPLTPAHCDQDQLGPKNLIGLRTFIQEVLKRSKTSYYTLQVALYYLILIKSQITQKSDSSESQAHAERAMQCGRRMFLAALILASKYLQDRNYSARAWSKISGLKISEINKNEMAFLQAVNWKLHIPEAQFHRWTDIVFKYSTSQSSLLFGECTTGKVPWKVAIEHLTPELNERDIEIFTRSSLCPPLYQPVRQASYYGLAVRQPVRTNSGYSSVDGDKTPTPSSMQVAPDASCMAPYLAYGSTYQSPPLSPRIPMLPTPSMTPSMQGQTSWCQGQTMREYMQRDSQRSIDLAAYEPWPVQGDFRQPPRPLTRKVPISSLVSSPESMVSDITTTSCSSRTSRSSSISSSVSSIGARSGSGLLYPVANHRSALGSLNGSGCVLPCMMPPSRSEPFIASNDSNPAENAEMDATMALFNMSRPCKRVTSQKNSRSEHGQKRARPISIADNNISDEVRQMLSQSYDANKAAVVPDSHQASSFVLSQPHLVENALPRGGTSQAGSRKKQRNSNSFASEWATGNSLKVTCLR